jgi:hypothetical protein
MRKHAKQDISISQHPLVAFKMDKEEVVDQFGLVQKFDGKRSSDSWVHSIDNIARLFQWRDEMTAFAAKRMMVGTAAFWLHVQHISAKEPNHWEDKRGQGCQIRYA